MADWPWPRDTTQDRLKRIIDSYRTALRDVDPTACDLVDGRMSEYGQTWLVNDEIVDVNAVQTATEIAGRFGLAPWDIQNWAHRYPEKLPKRGKRGGKNLFRVGDVLGFQVWLKNKTR